MSKLKIHKSILWKGFLPKGLIIILLTFKLFSISLGESNSDSDPLVVLGPTSCTYDGSSCDANALLYDDGTGVSYSKGEALVVTSWNDSVIGCLEINQVNVTINYDSANGGQPVIEISNDSATTWYSTSCLGPQDQTDKTYTCDVTSYFDCSNINQIATKVTHSDADAGKPSSLTLDLNIIKISYTKDTTPPIWSNQEQSTSTPGIGAKVNLSAYWQDNAALDNAWLATNETGSWKNYTDVYLVD
ncbi:MAG: hypothetical protein J7K83_01100, partial [Candidatus Aenigmarchaeota archaeon]|nr:hypothetical protein [Candidatus Aenigmarchaeota archaeon]